MKLVFSINDDCNHYMYKKISLYNISLFLGFNKNPSSWARFMQKTLNGARYAPELCFKQVWTFSE